ncbi:glyoxylate/hydroxypyruvate reductase GhrB [Pluralibacter gergoviae]|uniref:glyoxylate/hydroxypyruvate reductase GhrB n=1 Tax=Pluralibacter gergoviae TaxID=61647 RepID=UPI0006518A36|nr:glyoxylate/hydroxypyruvate reductase GhrB [Pluralibacter gergoviae]EKV0929710.1 glyoxylate/hydroxypyruvate reductase GhrB [Pluralibacter gergoviae]EKV6247718.1 glyoxylate/hydroxypyruvate reductase GhrB [Pluralibacter gergoviae]EKW9966884.1 glyoxylate/hydroxypyruvate reductase GhrB [Pluralibacter gergoviae]ELD4272896.1 glyoxylate/hydroxypyruvate reductase GhrB [Pluralibacter gergoviae]ELD4278450.1 glyoxylate/hydroxypyruvate reductase GhrB [Pluralibacter gergoviae]
MKPSVILYKKLPDDLEQRLDALFTVTRVPNLSEETVQQHAAEFAQAAGLLGAGGKVDAALLDKMPALRVASTVSVGYDNFDVDALTARKVVLMHTPTVLTETVADTLMALVLSTARRVVEVAERVKAGEWQKSIGPDWYGTDVHHKTIGIVGMGRIGMALAQRAHAGFGMPVLYNARRHHTEAEERFGARYCELDALLEEADFVCLILPLTDETRHLFGAEQFKKMKSSAIFINAGRGPVVDEEALIEALKSGEIHAAGLDVFEQEPLPRASELLTLPNVVALPHIGSATHETRYNMAADAVNNMINALDGKVEKNCVNPQVK